jgi:hypothetical protein
MTSQVKHNSPFYFITKMLTQIKLMLKIGHHYCHHSEHVLTTIDIYQTTFRIVEWEQVKTLPVMTRLRVMY